MKKKICLFLIIVMGVLCMAMPCTVSANDAGYLYRVYVCTSDGFLNMREDSTTKAKIITEIPDCVSIDIYSVDGDWGYGSCDLESEHYGWVYLPGTEMTYQKARDKAGKSVNLSRIVDGADGFVNMRHEPTSKINNVMKTIPNGQEIVVTRKTDKNWGLVYYGGEVGWIALSETKVPAVKTEEPEEIETETETPALLTEESTPPADSKKGSVSIEGDKILGGNALVLILIGVAIFLIVIVAILMIVILNRGKKEHYEERYTYREPRYYPPEQNTGSNYNQQNAQNQNYHQQGYQNYNNQNYRQ